MICFVYYTFFRLQWTSPLVWTINRASVRREWNLKLQFVFDDLPQFSETYQWRNPLNISLYLFLLISWLQSLELFISFRYSKNIMFSTASIICLKMRREQSFSYIQKITCCTNLKVFSAFETRTDWLFSFDTYETKFFPIATFETDLNPQKIVWPRCMQLFFNRFLIAYSPLRFPVVWITLYLGVRFDQGVWRGCQKISLSGNLKDHLPFFEERKLSSLGTYWISYTNVVFGRIDFSLLIL